jgi:AcrR family transcriptional regulator
VATGLSRRDRVRAATVTEIKDTARRILVAEGADGLSLRAIAREMGMTAPALYRYFPSREELVGALIGDLYDELTATLAAAARDATRATTGATTAAGAGGPDGVGSGADGVGDPRVGITAASWAFRAWALAHPREFGLLFGSPIPGIDAHSDDSPAGLASERFGQLFGDLVAQIYLADPFPVPADEEMDPELRRQLREWCSALPVELPVGAAQVFVSCWIRLYGMVAMEVFGHLRFALPDAAPMFAAELSDLGVKLGFGPPAS